MLQPDRPTRDRILDAALTLFGSRGFEAVSLDGIAAAVGVRKQTVLYWFESKDELLVAVVGRTADELAVLVEAALRTARAPGFGQVEAVVRAVFRPAVRRPALLGLIGELARLGPVASERLLEVFRPLADRAVAWLRSEMDLGNLRSADPRLTLALSYATVVGIATDSGPLRAAGWSPSAAGLRRLRAELLAFLRAALAP